MGRDWVSVQAAEAPDPLRKAVGGHPLIAQLLAQRGLVDPATALAFLDPEHYTPTLPADLPGVETATRLLRETVERRAKIRIWGDFDADGETATAVLYEALVALGAQVDYRLPGRQEGHGLSTSAIDDALREGVALLITCDTGIEAADQARRAVAAGLMLVITDHHDLPDSLPPADAVINPKMLPAGHPARELSGAGVACMLARALLETRADGAPVLTGLLDVVAIGLVADVAIQVGDVRYLIQRGLRVLRAGARPGLRALATLAGQELGALDEGSIGYQIGPRLNAAGRLDDATLGVRLLLTRDAQEAASLAQQLESINQDRQARTDALMAQVDERLRQNPDLVRQPAIVLDGEEWEAGVLGLVAGKLAHDYARPAVLIAHTPGRVSTASARSVPGVDIHAAIASLRQYLVREGGHPMAAGFALEREHLAAVRQGLLRHVAQQVPTSQVAPPLQIDAELPWSELTLTLARDLSRLAPFGAGNPKPLLLARLGTVVRTEDLSRKRETEHRRLHLLSSEGVAVRATWFNAGTLPQPGEPIDIAFHMGVNSYRGEERLDVTLVEWRPAEQFVARDVAALVAGREIVDKRSEHDWQTVLAALRHKHGDGLAVWAEGLVSPLPDTLSRYDLVGRRVPALAILTPPPEPAVLRAVLEETQSRSVYLLQPQPVHEPAPTEFVRRVAGMVRVSMEAREGNLDVLRMAARLGARQSAVMAALRGLELSGKLVIVRTTAGLVARLPEQPDDQGDRVGPDAERSAALQQTRAALAHLLAETVAYRRFFASEPVEAVFYVNT